MGMNGRERPGTTPGGQIDNSPLGMIVSNLRSLPRLLSLNQLARRTGVHRSAIMALSHAKRSNKSMPCFLTAF